MEENNSKEVNLLQLLSMFFKWVQKSTHTLASILGGLIKLAYRKKWLVIAVVLISVAGGMYLSRPSARVYKVGAMALLNGCDAQTVREVANQLENSNPLNPVTSIGSKLGLHDSVARNIIEFRSFFVVDFKRDSVADKVDFNANHPLTDTLNVLMRDRIYFRYKTLNINQVSIVEEAVLNYFNNNKLLKSQFDAKRAGIENIIKVTDSEFHRIDSMTGIFYFKENPGTLKMENTLLVGEQRKQIFYGELLDLTSRNTVAKTNLAMFVSPVDIPSGFIVNPVPLNNRMKYGIFSLFIGFVLGVLIAVVVENFEKIFQFLSRK